MTQIHKEVKLCDDKLIVRGQKVVRQAVKSAELRAHLDPDQGKR